MKQIRKRLTYANVMSSIAVFLIIGGASAFAASQLGKNSVGTKQLKKNSVTGTKVKNHSLKATDFVKNSLPKGPKGATGPAGPQGQPGNTNTFTYKRTAKAGETISIATFGPFTLHGECSGSESNPTAQWTLSTSQEHSAFTDYDNSYLSDFGPGDGERQIEYDSTSASPTEPEMEGPYDGTFAALSADLKTYITGSLSTETYVGGPSNPPCGFFGVVFSAA